MNCVGYLGRGESVWLAFFLCDVLTRFSDLALVWGDTPFSEICASEVTGLKRRIEESAWDGRWYLRAYFDGEDPLGSEKNPECKIDSISQSWSVLSMAGDHDRYQGRHGFFK